MRPLVYYCRWHQARLLLRGRNEQAVWGELIYPNDQKEYFYFQLKTKLLQLGEGETLRHIQLDEMGVEQK